MSQQLACDCGHRWIADYHSGQGVCPQCGAQAALTDYSTSRDPSLRVSGELPPPPRPGRMPPAIPQHAAGSLPEAIGRYRIERLLGQGGMGAVYLARDEQLDRRVALKVPHLGIHQDPRIVERFIREARAAATLDHPNICSVYDVGQIDGLHFISMAYIEGQTLASLIRANPEPLPQPGVADLIRKLALALAEAHDRGVVHRDLKPANIMINSRHEPVIMDFGLARRGGGSDPQITAEGAVIGTPGYMSPEQVAGEQGKIGPATDIHALGVILYELLTQRRPFEGSTGEVLSQIATQPAPPLSGFRADVDPKLSDICLKALRKRIDDRFASMREFAGALSGWLQAAPFSIDESGATRLVHGASDQRAAEEPTQKTSSLELAAQLLANLAARIESGDLGTHPQITVSPRRRIPWWVWTGGAALLAVLATLAVLPFIKPSAAEAPVTIHIDNTYINAVFYLDGKRIERDQLDNLKLPVGRHELVVKRDGVEVARQTLNVTREGPQKFELEPIATSNIAKSKAAKRPAGNNAPLPNVTVDPSLEIWSTPYSSGSPSPLQTTVWINGDTVATWGTAAQGKIARHVKPGWNHLKLTTRPRYPVERANTLAFTVGPASGAPGKSRSMKPVWKFFNGGGWKFQDGKYTHQSGPSVQEVELGIRLYYAGLERDARMVQRGDFVVQSGAYTQYRNPSVTVTLFINGTPLTTFGALERQTVITDLLKPGLNEVRLVTDRVDGELENNDVQLRILGPADYFAGAGTTRLRKIAWISAMAGWRRDEKSGALVNTVDPKSSRLERTIPLYLPGPVDRVGRFSLDGSPIVVFSKRDSSYRENSLHSEMAINGKAVGLFTSDTQESLAGAWKRNDWNVLTLRTKSQYPVGGDNRLSFHIGAVGGAAGGTLKMPDPLWSFHNGDGWRNKDGRLVHQVRPDAGDVSLTFHLFLAGAAESHKETEGGYLLQAEPYTSYRNPSLTATVFLNGKPLTTFAGQKRSIVLGPLARKGMNEFRLITRRVDNVLQRNDTTISLMGPAKYSPASGRYQYPLVQKFSALDGWKSDPQSGRLVNQKDPKSETLDRVIRLELK